MNPRPARLIVGAAVVTTVSLAVSLALGLASAAVAGAMASPDEDGQDDDVAELAQQGVSDLEDYLGREHGHA